MKVLITGAAGFIGSNLTEYLLARGFDVVGVDNFNDFYNPKIKEYNIKNFLPNEHFKLYRTDILNASELEKVFIQEKNIDAIVHFAAWAGVTLSLEKPVVYVKNNIEGTVNLLESAVKYQVGNFLFASTSSIYGDNPTPHNENMPTDLPLAPYPATKKACEVMISTYKRNYGLNATIFRIYNPLGPRMRPDLALPKLIRSCLYGVEFPQYWANNQETKRDYTYVIHMLEAMEYVIKHPFKYEIFNLGNSSPVDLGTVIKAVETVTGKTANLVIKPPRKGEMVDTFANIDKARKTLGYNPTTTVEQLVKIYYDWFVLQEDWYKKGEF